MKSAKAILEGAASKFGLQQAKLVAALNALFAGAVPSDYELGSAGRVSRERLGLVGVATSPDGTVAATVALRFRVESKSEELASSSDESVSRAEVARFFGASIPDTAESAWIPITRRSLALVATAWSSSNDLSAVAQAHAIAPEALATTAEELVLSAVARAQAPEGELVLIEGTLGQAFRVVAQDPGRGERTLAQVAELLGDPTATLELQVGEEVVVSVLLKDEWFVELFESLVPSVVSDAPVVHGHTSALRDHRQLLALPVDTQTTAALKSSGYEGEPARQLYADGQYGVAFMPIPGEGGTEIYKKLLELAPKTGRWPVVLGAADAVLAQRPVWESLREQVATGESNLPCSWEAADSPSAIIERAKALDFSKIRTRYAGYYDHQLKHGPWPESHVDGKKTLSGFEGFDAASWRNRVLPRVYLALVPAAEPWMVPAYVPQYGVGENTPSPVILTAILRHYDRRYGARVATLRGDTVEVFVTRTPSTRDEALSLMDEWLTFAAESFSSRSLTSIEDYAHHYQRDPLWYWWWD